MDQAQLDAWSKEAMKLSPAPAVCVARGAVLVASERVVEGRDLLLQALSEPLDRGIAADAHGFLAVAEALLGDMAAAEAWIKQAKAGSVGTGSAHNMHHMEQQLAMIRRKALSKSWN